MKNLRLLFVSAFTLSSISVCALAAQDDPLASFPIGFWIGTYETQKCGTTETYSSTATLLVVDKAYTPGTPSSVSFKGSLTLANFPNNYNSYATGVNLNKSFVFGVSSPYMAQIVPENSESDILPGNYFTDTSKIKLVNPCAAGVLYGVDITLFAPKS